MREEFVTKSILSFLTTQGWRIVSFDFPQSGTGRLLHPDDFPSEKNKGGITPDIIAVKDGIAVFFENKNRFYYPDFEKVHRLIEDNHYTRAIASLLEGTLVTEIYYGIGMPVARYSKKASECASMVDFIVGVKEDGCVSLLTAKASIQFH